MNDPFAIPLVRKNLRRHHDVMLTDAFVVQDATTIVLNRLSQDVSEYELKHQSSRNTKIIINNNVFACVNAGNHDAWLRWCAVHHDDQARNARRKQEYKVTQKTKPTLTTENQQRQGI